MSASFCHGSLCVELARAVSVSGSVILEDLNLAAIAKGAGLRLSQVEKTVGLLDDGNTVPFITRYRKDQTGGLDEEQIRAVEQEVAKARQLIDRKQTILRSIDSQGKLTGELVAQIRAAESMKWLEDLYLPFKPKKQTRATLARERGLEKLANEILAAAPACSDLDARAAEFVNPDREVQTAADALLGAGHILSERFSERADLRRWIRRIFRQTGHLVSTKIGKDEEKGKGFRDYFNFRQPVFKVPPHRILAINRGEKAKHLKVRVEADADQIQQAAEDVLVPAEHPHAEFLRGCVRDALARLVSPAWNAKFAASEPMRPRTTRSRCLPAI